MRWNRKKKKLSSLFVSIFSHNGTQSILGKHSIRTDFGLQMFAIDDRGAPANFPLLVDCAERKEISTAKATATAAHVLRECATQKEHNKNNK